MPRFTIIDRLPKDVREAIDRWRTEEALTIDEVLAKLKEEFGVTVVRSTLALHIQKRMDAVGTRLRELREVSEGMSRAIGEGDTQKVGALNRELAHVIMLRLQTAKDDKGKDVSFNPMEAMLIAKALDHLASAEKKDTDRALAVTKALGKEVKKKIEGIAAEVAAGGENKPDAMAVLKKVREIYNIFDEPKK